MLTPVFSIGQSDRYLLLTIRAPYCKLTEAEVTYDDRTFLFHARPYFLRLNLPGKVIDDETGTCDYDIDKGQFTISVPKKNPGEHFANLEMLSELLKPQQTRPSGNLPVELIGGADKSEDKDEATSQGSQSESVEDLISDEYLYADQKLMQKEEQLMQKEEQPSISTRADLGYGFGWTRHGVFIRFCDEMEELIDLADPDEVLIEERTKKLREFDEKHFQEQHYLADLFDPEQLQLDAMEFQLEKEQHLKLTEEDLADLKDLKIRQLEKFSAEVTEQIAFSLIDILFGFHYDLRTTLGEHNVESGWTISKLSPSLTYLVRWPTMFDAVTGTIRHSLVIPLIRNWDFSVKVMRDVLKTLKAGRVAILHCLLCCRRVFNRSGEFRYLFNQLFLDDLCLWIQSVPDELLTKLRLGSKQVLSTLTKADILELDLEFIEMQAQLKLLNPIDSDDEAGS